LTLGPGGRNVALEYEGGDPKITKDGVTVVRSITERDRAKECASKLLKQVAGNTNKYGGDGTTTSTLLAKELIEKSFNSIRFEGAHPIAMKRGMDKGLRVINDYLKSIAMPVTSYQEIYNVCQVSSNRNENITDIVAKTLTTVGLDGVINLIESPTGKSQF